MEIYGDLVVILNFLVDFLLLLGTNRLSGHPPAAGRAALAAGLGGCYAMACLIPGFYFLGNTLWRGVSLMAMAAIAFGLRPDGIRRMLLFVLLTMALGGLATGFQRAGFGTLVLSAGGLWLLCRWGFRGHVGSRNIIPMSLRYGEKTVKIRALRDTGNTLRDPITGEGVVILGREAAMTLTGVTAWQLEHPVAAVSAGRPGFRLVPYRAVGKDAGMLLAMKLDVEREGKWERQLVAFAPGGLDPQQEYQALTGG